MLDFPSINQYRHVIKQLQLDYPNKDTFDFTGTVKLHGTNAGIIYDGTNVSFRSRSREITVGDDNYGFAAWGQKLIPIITQEYTLPENYKLAIYGEWCGQGIQSGVAISELPRMFVIFAIRSITDEGDFWWMGEELNEWKLDLAPLLMQEDIKLVTDFGVYKVSVNTTEPQFAQAALTELTDKVEAECPVGKAFGVSGIGEGIVWSLFNLGKLYTFKVKGQKHSSSKVKTLAAVDVEALKTKQEFVETVVTESRLLQGLEYLKENNLEVGNQTIGDYLRWVIGDIIKEESDTLEASGLTIKDVSKPISTTARQWYQSQYL